MVVSALPSVSIVLLLKESLVEYVTYRLSYDIIWFSDEFKSTNLLWLTSHFFFLKIDVVHCLHVQSYHSHDEATTSMFSKFAAVNKYNMNIGTQNLVQTKLFNFFR